MSDCRFSIVINYGTHSLEWRPLVGPPNKDLTPSPFLAHSRWELTMMQALVEEFQHWLKEQGV